MRWPRPECVAACAGLALLLAIPAAGAVASARETHATALLEIPGLPGPLRRRLVNRHFDAYDAQQGGLLLPYKTLDPYHTEYALFRARLGDATSASRVRRTLDAARALQDQADGGFYARAFGEWGATEGEKFADAQPAFLRCYALAALQWPDAGYLPVAQGVREYLLRSLPARRAADNGWAVEALATLYRASRDPADLRAALDTGQWLLASRRLPNGGFRGAAPDAGAEALADTLAAGAGFLALHRVTGRRGWLQQAVSAADFLVEQFRNPQGGYNSTRSSAPVLEENIRVTRYLNLLSHYTGRADLLQAAQHAMRFVSRPGPARAAFELSGALLADDELGRDPLRLVVVGSRADTRAGELFRAALAVPGTYQRVEWWDPSEPPPQPSLPLTARAAVYACADRFCTPATHDPARLPELVLQVSTVPD